MRGTETRRHLLHGVIGLLRELRATTEGGYYYEDKMIAHHADALLTRVNKLIEDVPELKAPDMGEVMSMKVAKPVPEGTFHAYECMKCGQFFPSNPEDPSPPHCKPGCGDEWCVTEEEWRQTIEDVD